jgi:hypothetical protein
VDGTATTCTQRINLGVNIFPSNMLVDTSGRFLYVTANQLLLFSIDPSSGALTQLLTIPNISFFPGSAVADPMGPYIYNQGSGVHVYQVDQQTGNLTEIGGSPFGTGAGSIAITGAPTQATSGPGAQIFPLTANFGSVTVGKSSSTQVFSIVNTGNAPLNIASVVVAGANPGSFLSTNTCATPVAPNANCTVSVTFSPVSAGTQSATLKVADNASGSPQTLALGGVGLAAVPAVTLMPATPSFPTITEGMTGSPQTLTIINSGDAALHVASAAIGGANPSDFNVTNSCSAAVAPGASCSMALVFAPIGPGVRTATLIITDDSGTSPEMVSLSGTAEAAVTIIATGAITQSVAAGQATSYPLTLTPGSGFSGTISLTCSGAPLGARCSVPATVTVASNANAAFTVTVSTSGAAHGLAPYSNGPGTFGRWPVLCALILLLTAVLARSNRAGQVHRIRFVWSGAFAAMVLFAVFGVGGCGGGAASSTGPPPPPVITPAGTYTLTVTPSAMSGTGKALQLQPISLTLTVGP